MQLLELHTLGVHGGYTQQDVMEVARGLTGWTIRSTAEKPYYAIGKVEFKADLHDFGAKQILGHTLPASTEAKPKKDEMERIASQDLDRILEIVTVHPSTARHIASKLCRHFIADAPPPSAVEQVAAVFTRTRGDIKETLRTLFHAREFDEQRGNKLKRPFAFIASALRASGAQTDAGMGIIEYLNRMGHAPFSYPTPEGYPDTAPHWLGTLLWRWNFAVALGENQIKGTKIDVADLRKNAGGDPGLMRHILGRQPTEDEASAYKESDAGLALLLASPAFQMC